MTLPDYFTNKTRQSTCTVWVGSCNNKGYGIVQVNGKLELAHRIAYEDANGPIAEGMVIDHMCRVRNCVNPEHLEAVTQRENIRRGRMARTLQPGDTCINGHLIESEADLYRRASGTAECRACRASGGTNGHRRTRPTVQRRARKYDEQGVLKRSA